MDDIEDDRHRVGKPTIPSAFAAWGYLNSHRAASSLMRLVEGEEKWQSPDHPHGILHQYRGGTEPNLSVTCVMLKATANGRRH
ncbi:hypothetical protein TNCV_2126521 [Trichonephila clavipes]|nr:hypothetical protein TNCV_2126521 [Trichonephila clavipes]